MTMEKEYESLRQETLQWQSRRFDIMAGSIIGVTAILGWVVSSPNSWSWAVASILPLSFLSSACFLTCLFNRAIALIGTYLEVFHNSGWNTRVRKFRFKSSKILTLTSGFILIYLGLGIISIILSYIVCSKTATRVEVILFSVVCFLFFLMLIILRKLSYPRHYYISVWQEIKDQENEKSQGKSA
jgi:hypothetical protein